MELGQRGSEERVLNGGEDPVSDPLVERHPALQGLARLHHPAAEHCVGLAGGQRLQKVGQALRSVLAVPVDHGDQIELVRDRVGVPRLLVAAVPLIDRVAKHRQRNVRVVFGKGTAQ